MGKFLILIGIIAIIAGILVTYKISIPFLGKLPGDINVTGENYQVYFPITTCILISAVISLLFYLFSSKS